MFNIINGTESFYDSYDFETVDSLLSRDWFIDNADIDDVLNFANKNAWDLVYANRTKYSTRIRMLIEPEDYRVPIETLNTKVVDMTDSMFDTLQMDKLRKRNNAFEKDWIIHSKTIQERKFDEVDFVLDDAWNNLTFAKDALENYLATPSSKKYVVPTGRGSPKVSYKQVELEDRFSKMKNEYELAHAAVDKADTIFWEDKKNEYRKIWMPTL